jgi:hypothetical protein
MKTRFFTKSLYRIKAISILALLPEIIHAQNVRLYGITGQQGNGTLINPEDPQSFQYPDHTLFDINLTTGALTKVMRMTFVNDSQAIGYCPADGMLYHTAGSESYSSNPFRSGNDNGGETISGVGYQDSHYMEAVNLTTRVATGIFNAAPCPNPDPVLPCFGLPAPRPGWVLPVERRDSTQTDDSYRARGPNEYHAVRDMAWSASRNVFYISDDEGIFKLGLEGDCTFLSRPSFPTDGSVEDCKGIAFVKVGNQTKLFVGHRNGVGDNGLLMEIDPEDGDFIAEIPLTYPTGGGFPQGQFGGLLGIDQHPLTGVVYGIRKTSDNFGRELVTINPVTGATTLVGNMGLHIASIAFVSPPFTITGVTRNADNLTITWAGGVPPYQVQVSPNMTDGSWVDSGAPTTSTTATIALSGQRSFIRVKGQ